MSDIIEAFIQALLEDSDDVELKRNELAQYFGCAPSQINYVLTTRFSVDHGYIVQSKRGGGGYIMVRRIPAGEENLQACLTEQIGQQINLPRARALIQNLHQNRKVTEREAAIMSAAVANIPMLAGNMQDYARSYVLRSMIKAILNGQCGQNRPASQDDVNGVKEV